MDECDRLTREELIALVRELRAGRAAPCGPAAGVPAGLPVFGERALREFENSASPMRIFDFETLRYLAVNDAAVKFYGFSREEFLSLTAKDIRHPEEHAAFVETLAEQAEYLRYRPLRRHVKKSGEIVVVEAITQDVLFDGRKARLSLTIDITARVRMQELLWRRQQEFEALAENIPHLVVRFDRDHRFIYVNSAVEKLLGMPRQRLVGSTQRELGLPEEVAVKFAHSLERVLRGGEPHGLEFSLPAAGGERRFEACQVPERDASGELTTVLCIAHDVTERSRSERVLRETNEFLRSVIESSRNCIKVLDLDGNLMMMNDGGKRLLEIDDLAPLLNTSWVELWPVAERQKVRSALATAASGRVCDFEGYAPTLKGSAGWWETTVTPILGADGRPARLLAVSREISRRRQSQDRQSRLAAIVEYSHDAILSRKLDGTITTWNRAAERLLGYAASEIIGQNIRMIIPVEQFARMQERQALLEQGAGVLPHETVRIAKDGRRIDVLTSSAPIRDSSGDMCGVSTIIRDITEMKRAEEELRASEERFRQLAENIDQVFWINTPAIDRNLYVSPAYEKIWGREAQRHDSASWMDSVHPEDLPPLREALARVKEGVHLDVEYRIVRPNGQVRWIRDRSYPMKAGDGTPLICGLAEDITGQKRAEEQRLADAVRQRDALVREVHHRIKNSLQGVAGLLRQKIRRYPAISPGIEEAIAQLQSVALVYGLQETRSDGLLSLAEITDAICSSAESLIGGRVERTFERSSQRAVCVAGPEAVSVAVALNELVFNALKHHPSAAGKKRIRVALSETRSGAEIRIANRGRLPEGFDFAEGRAVGNGLGLVRTLLASPGGEIRFSGVRNEVEVVVKLSAPLLARPQNAITARVEDEDAKERRETAAYPAGGR